LPTSVGFLVNPHNPNAAADTAEIQAAARTSGSGVAPALW
jgi:hypothetical protein